ncbi:hypothetical protein M408DRAFT_169493 [Serendipita vermifera MAFF 305830]|uniref:Uncharacterized protein n=1 Tax=Serendipita vermifera MAFF 305830 TaxID=933852 RepID=A0A0C3B5C0_SERVB|nr:hypothetical protein M408DRAFT_169493 [Serendipita vermifera MAFF 305830]
MAEQATARSARSSLYLAISSSIRFSEWNEERTMGINWTSVYVDLGVLYGVDEMAMSGERKDGKPSDDERTRGMGGHDGAGRLWEDTWADDGSCCRRSLVVLCRNHNTTCTTALSFFTRARTFFIRFDDEPRQHRARSMIYKVTHCDGANERMLSSTCFLPQWPQQRRHQYRLQRLQYYTRLLMFK